MSRVLIVDDDAGVREMISLALRALGHDVETAPNGFAGLAALGSCPEVVILDVMMPGIDGFETCRRMRVASQIPIVMLTARSDPFDIVAGLECGADDYVTKPVEPRVLDARIKALLRRVAPPAPQEPSLPDDNCLVFGELVINEAALLVTRAGQAVDLSATELKLLLCLARNAGQVMTRAVLLDRVWDYGYEGDSRLVDATIQRLRAKIEPDPARPEFIATVRGFGYRMERR